MQRIVSIARRKSQRNLHQRVYWDSVYSSFRSYRKGHAPSAGTTKKGLQYSRLVIYVAFLWNWVVLQFSYINIVTIYDVLSFDKPWLSFFKLEIDHFKIPYQWSISQQISHLIVKSALVLCTFIINFNSDKMLTRFSLTSYTLIAGMR